MPEEREETGLQAMLEESQRHIHQRVTTVETSIVEHEKRLSLVEVKQSGIDRALEKLAETMSIQATKATLNEAAIVAIRERTDVLADHMEKVTDQLAGTQEKSGERLNKLEGRVDRQDTKWTALQAFAVAAMGVLLTIALQHLSALFH